MWEGLQKRSEQSVGGGGWGVRWVGSHSLAAGEA